MKMDRRILSFLSVLAWMMPVSVAFASCVELEPYAGYGFLGALGTSVQYSSKTNNTLSTLGFGLRTLYKFDPGIYVGPDFSYQIGLSVATTGQRIIETLNGVSYKFGLGYNITQNLYLNAEYFIKSYGSVASSVKGVGRSVKTLTGAEVLNGNLLLVSISAPLNVM